MTPIPVPHPNRRPGAADHDELAHNLVVRTEWVHAILAEAYNIPLDVVMDSISQADNPGAVVDGWQRIALAFLCYRNRHPELPVRERREVVDTLMGLMGGRMDLPAGLDQKIFDELRDLYDTIS